ncbi:MAG TPA: response regulator transcription factor [Dehalococcoidia bacterium]|nr:response regulator transcription factor [Dehalococcoidia bacterium]
MPARRVLVVDDDRKAVEMVRIYLERDGYKVLPAYDGPSALELARAARPDLIVLDLMLPGIGGLEICRALRKDSCTPIIMLTARSAEDDKLLGLDLGADDYVTKPFSPRELLARVRAVLRRTAEKEEEAKGDIHIGSLTLSLRRREALVDGRPVALTASEFDLLAALMQEPGRAFSRLQLLEKAFGDDFEGLERNVDVHVMNLRRKLGLRADGAIKAVYGVGYKFEAS